MSEAIRRIAVLDVPVEAMREMFLVLAEQCEKKTSGAERQARYRNKKRNGVTSLVTPEPVTNDAPHAGAPGIDKTLPSLTTETVRKEDPPIVPPALISKPLPSRRGTRLPDDFVPDETCHVLAEKLLLSRQESQQAFDEFRDYWRGVPGAKGSKTDWNATFRNQLRRVASMKGNRRGQTANGHKPGSFDDEWGKVDAVLAEAKRRENGGNQADHQTDVVVLPGLRQGTG